MKRFIFLCSAISLLATQSNMYAQAKLVETVTKKGDEIVIPYEKYVLPNGLTLILHEDHSDPLVHVDVTYHVGSAREEIGKSGFAHFFEHMMFQGSDNVGDEQHFKIITEAGGTLNGTTNRDRTNYFETVPANQLEKMLWLEADRMGFLLDAVTQKKFEIQRATVKNERGQRYDNQPYGLMGEVSAKNLYPYGHPYSWLTIGYIEDLDRVGVEDLKNFFLRWYGPNNAVLTVGGDFDKKQTLAWIEKYFGSIPRGAEVTPAKYPLPVINKDRYITMSDNYAKVNMMRMVFPTVKSYDKDEAALDCLSDILGRGKNSLLYKNLVKAGLASNAGSYNYTSELAGEFTINVTPYPGKSLEEMHKVVRQTLAEFEKRGVTDDDVKKYISKIEAQIIYGLESVSGKVSRLAAFHTFTGNANYLPTYFKQNTSITKADVKRVYEKYIKNKAAVVLSVTTKNDPDNIVAPQNYTVSEDGYTAPDYGYDGLVYNKAKDSFDRSKMPNEGAAVVIKAPKIWKNKIGNTMQVIGTETDEIPVINIIIGFKGGKYMERKEQSGLADLFATMMNEGTQNYTAEEFALALEQLGSSIYVGSSNDETVVQVSTLKKNLNATIALLEERLLRYTFTQEDFDRNQKRTIQNLNNAMNRPSYVASTVFPKLLYEETAIKSYTTTEESLKNIRLEDIQLFAQNYLSTFEGEIVVVGDISEKEIMDKLAFINTKISNHPVFIPRSDKLAMPSVIEKGKVIYYVDIPGAAQTEFRIGVVNGITYDALGQSYKNTVTNYPLGGAFNSRLNLYLREEKGWTYGARSGFGSDKYTGTFTFSGGIKADATDSALTDVLRIIEEYKTKGAKAEELQFTKSAMSQSEALKYETGMKKAGFLGNILTYNLPSDYTAQQNEILKKMQLKDLNENAKNYLPKNSELVILLVGDKNNIVEQAKAKGFKTVELDKFGAVKQ